MPLYRTTGTANPGTAPTSTAPAGPTPPVTAPVGGYDPTAIGGGTTGTLDADMLTKYILYGSQSLQALLQGVQTLGDQVQAAGGQVDPLHPVKDPTWKTGYTTGNTGAVPTKYTVADNPALNADARAHQHDYDWMVAHGYVPTKVALGNTSAGSDGRLSHDSAPGVKWQLLSPGGTFAAVPREDLGATFTDSKLLPKPANASRTTPVMASTQTMLKTLFGMDTDQLTVMQRKLFDGGYFGSDRPTWGILDDATQTAYVNAMKTALSQPDKTFDDVIDSSNDLGQVRSARAAKMQKALADAGFADGPTIKVTDSRTLDQTMTAAASKLIGRDLTPEERQTFINSYHGAESADQRAAYEQAVKQASQSAQGVNDQSLDSMLDGIAQLNGGLIIKGDQAGFGSYGIRNQDWKGWLQKLGMDPTTAQTPDNERAVTKELMLAYFDKFGNWQDAATAFLAGAGSGYQQGGSWNAIGTAKDLGKQIAGRMSDTIQQSADSIEANALAARGTTIEQAPTPDAAATTFLQDTHPVEYVGHSAADRAGDFLTMLTGGPGGR